MTDFQRLAPFCRRCGKQMLVISSKQAATGEMEGGEAHYRCPNRCAGDRWIKLEMRWLT